MSSVSEGWMNGTTSEKDRLRAEDIYRTIVKKPAKADQNQGDGAAPFNLAAPAESTQHRGAAVIDEIFEDQQPWTLFLEAFANAISTISTANQVTMYSGVDFD